MFGYFTTEKKDSWYAFGNYYYGLWERVKICIAKYNRINISMNDLQIEYKYSIVMWMLSNVVICKK